MQPVVFFYLSAGKVVANVDKRGKSPRRQTFDSLHGRSRWVCDKFVKTGEARKPAKGCVDDRELVRVVGIVVFWQDAVHLHEVETQCVNEKHDGFVESLWKPAAIATLELSRPRARPMALANLRNDCTIEQKA